MQPKDPYFPFPKAPFDHAALTKALDKIFTDAPTTMSLGSLGDSILGHGIPLLRIGHGPRHLLYVGAHHGMEWITSVLLCRFVAELRDALEEPRHPQHASIKAIASYCTLHIVPMLNPDGVAYQLHGPDPQHPLYARVITMNGGSTDFSHWQANARGVDLNHNYNVGFIEYKAYERQHEIPCGAPTKYSGSAPESEPECAALCNYIRFLGRPSLVLSLHTQGEEIYFSSGTVTLPQCQRLLPHVAKLSGYTPAVPQGSAAYGGLLDWCLRTIQCPAFTLECGKGHNPLPLEHASAIYARLRPLFFALPRMVG